MKRNKVLVRCQQCGKEFETIPSIIKKGYGKYCSRVCDGESKRTRYLGESNPRWREGNEHICAVCGAKFRTRKSQANRKICSFSCYGEYKKRFHVGENHSKWEGGRIIINNGGKEYIGIYAPDHPHAHHGYVKEHILIVESALNKPFPHSAVVHHIDHDGTNNSSNNLILCQDSSYHAIIHARERRLSCQKQPE